MNFISSRSADVDLLAVDVSTLRPDSTQRLAPIESRGLGPYGILNDVLQGCYAAENRRPRPAIPTPVAFLDRLERRVQTLEEAVADRDREIERLTAELERAHKLQRPDETPNALDAYLALQSPDEP